MPHAEVAPLLKRGFVALASDVDDPEEEVLALARNLENARMLPFVLFTDEHGHFVTGSSGSVNATAFKSTLTRLLG